MVSNKQIGWSQEANLLHAVSKQLERLAGIIATSGGGGGGTITLTTTGNSGAATLVGTILNVPTYTLTGLGGVPTTRTITINGVSQALSANVSFTTVTPTSTDTFTNKTIVKRVVTIAFSASVTIAADTGDIFKIANVTSDFTVNAPTGTPVEGQMFQFMYRAGGVYNITWNTIFESSSISLPAQTSTSTPTRLLFQYSTDITTAGTAKWVLVGFA